MEEYKILITEYELRTKCVTLPVKVNSLDEALENVTNRYLKSNDIEEFDFVVHDISVEDYTIEEEME